MERAVILAREGTIDTDSIQISHAHVDPPAALPAEIVTLAEAERRAIVTALVAAHWRISGRDGAAERLALKPTTLHAKMKKLGIHRPLRLFV
jgi:transcriptional regulator with GAF, ATPase, and Fis domain